MQPFPKLTLVTGGAASGKSAWAEKLVRASQLPKAYIATAQAFDDDMRAKITKHQADRGKGWQVIEAPLDLPQGLKIAQKDTIILIDCLTMWLSNHLLAGNDIDPLIDELLFEIANSPALIVVVTNEVGQCIVPDNALAREFQRHQGHLNQRVAQQSNLVIAILSGLPLALKGSIPEVAI